MAGGGLPPTSAPRCSPGWPVGSALPDVRPATRPAHFADAGLTVLRVPRSGAGGEIWCRLDGGPHGFGSIAAHAHADALSVELRCGGVDVLADPGCYCYHGEPAWRALLPLHAGAQHVGAGRDGPVSVGRAVPVGAARDITRDRRPYRRWRCVALDRRARRLRPPRPSRSPTGAPSSSTRASGSCGSSTRCAPTGTTRAGSRSTSARPWTAELDGRVRRCAGPTAPAAAITADARPARRFTGGCYRGQSDPPLGWYSPGFGRREPAVTVVGRGRIDPRLRPAVQHAQARCVSGGRDAMAVKALTGALAAALLLSACAGTASAPAPPAGSDPAANAALPIGRIAAGVRPHRARPGHRCPRVRCAIDPEVDADLTAKTKANPPGTTFWLAPGVHTLGTDQYGQVEPKEGDVYIGAPGAVIDGRGHNQFAFIGYGEERHDRQPDRSRLHAAAGPRRGQPRLGRRLDRSRTTRSRTTRAPR